VLFRSRIESTITIFEYQLVIISLVLSDYRSSLDKPRTLFKDRKWSKGRKAQRRNHLLFILLSFAHVFAQLVFGRMSGGSALRKKVANFTRKYDVNSGLLASGECTISDYIPWYEHAISDRS